LVFDVLPYRGSPVALACGGLVSLGYGLHPDKG
jgi:hypothetical protein